jgi:polyisoprenoid-binding protein YceI
MKKLAALLVCIGASAAWAGWSVVGEGEAGFSGSGPAGFKIDGKTKLLSVKDDGKNLSVVVGLKDLDTGITLRDKHMRDKYLEVEKFPEATLTVPLDGVKLADGTNEGEGKGTFTCHGVTKDATFKYKATCKGGECDVEGTAPVNMNDHGVNVPSYMGITVKPNITVRATFKAKKG